MSKFVAIIDDENYTCPLEHEGCCHIAWNKIYNCMEDCDGILNARPEFCPLKEYKEAIPVEWIKKWINNIANNERYKNDYVELTEEIKRIVYRQEMMIIRIPCISDMLEDWEKENETD